MYLFYPISASLDVASLSRSKFRPRRFRRCRACKKMEGTLPIRIQSQYTVSQYPFYFTGSHTLGKMSMISKNLIDICLYFQQWSPQKSYWRGIRQWWCRLWWRYVAEHFLVNVFMLLCRLDQNPSNIFEIFSPRSNVYSQWV